MTDALGAALTLSALGLLGAGGYLGARLALGANAQRDRLGLAVATLLLVHVQAVGVALLLGIAGQLRLVPALALQALLVAALWIAARRRFADPWTPLGQLLPAIAARAREDAALSIVAAHVLATEGLRALLRPPLAWDGLMYHLWLTTSWLHSGDLLPPLGPTPANYYAYVPADGSLWMWWWMAPSHSELYVGLSAFPAALLVALAAGALARRLGATHSWPLVAFAAFSTPIVARYLGAQYVDLLLGGALLAGIHFGLEWVAGSERLENSEGSSSASAACSAALAAAGAGLAAGTKVLGAPYAALAGLAIGIVGISTLVRTRGARLPRFLLHLLVAVLVAAPLGGFFYARNLALGTDALAVTCEMTATGPEEARPVTFPRAHSVADRWQDFLSDGSLADAFLGTNRAQSLEMGFGPLVLAWLLAILIAFGVRFPDRAANVARWVLLGQIVGHLTFWFLVPYANHGALYANLRYLVPALAMGLGLGFALLERRGVSRHVMALLALALAVQGLLQQRPDMPRGGRMALALADLIAVVLILTGHRLSSLWRRRPLSLKVGPVPARVLALALVAAVVALIVAPRLADFRVADRARAYKTDVTVHQTTARFQADAWQWFESPDAGEPTGIVAHVQSPSTYFLYPPGGTRLSRQVVYVNVNSENQRFAADYPRCEPRQDFDVEAWLENLRASGARHLYLARFVEFPFPIEDAWARVLPEVFTLRYEDPGNRIYDVRF